MSLYADAPVASFTTKVLVNMISTNPPRKLTVEDLHGSITRYICDPGHASAILRWQLLKLKQFYETATDNQEATYWSSGGLATCRMEKNY